MKTGLEATEISASSARQKFSKIIDAVRVAGERILITQHGRPVAAVIGVEDLQLLQLLEDHMDVAEARRRIREPADKISLEDLRNGIVPGRQVASAKPQEGAGHSGVGLGRLERSGIMVRVRMMSV